MRESMQKLEQAQEDSSKKESEITGILNAINQSTLVAELAINGRFTSINDGFLTPFKVRQIATTLDEYRYTPDDTVVEGEIEELYDMENDPNELTNLALKPAHRQRQLAMRAGVFQRNHFASAGPVNADLLTQNADLVQLVSDLIAPGRDVPRVL